MFCKQCGKEIADNAAICPSCGVPTANKSTIDLKKLYNTLALFCTAGLIGLVLLSLNTVITALASPYSGGDWFFWMISVLNVLSAGAAVTFSILAKNAKTTLVATAGSVYTFFYIISLLIML